MQNEIQKTCQCFLIDIVITVLFCLVLIFRLSRYVYVFFNKSHVCTKPVKSRILNLDVETYLTLMLTISWKLAERSLGQVMHVSVVLSAEVVG